jgi:protein involved in polysaccharide export with SLBB domain
LPPTETYHVGAGDVLDIRLLNQGATRESTLFTVIDGGLLEYPLAGAPRVVTGLTTDEIGSLLAAELKRRAVYDKPRVMVSVREYASHTVLVSGLVNEPGAKIMRREAIPLYVLIAEAQPKPEAGRALVIARATGQSTSVDLSDNAAMSTLIYAGDVVQVQPRPREFFYIGGAISLPGQKDFHGGLTLTQAVLASGGLIDAANGRIRVARQGADGRLISIEHNLKDIEAGKVPDPGLQPGDRVEVLRGKR